MNDHPGPPQATCPFDSAGLPAQKTDRSNHKDSTTTDNATVAPDAHGTWHVRGFNATKAVLRASHTRQAGFRAEQVARLPGKMRPPILYQEGDSHRDQRTRIARFFTPLTTSTQYRGFMESFSDSLVEELKQQRRADLSDISMGLAVQVAAQVIGLTNSRTAGMSRRIEAFFEQGGATSKGYRKVLQELRNQWRVGRFYFMDVQPAVQARRRKRQEDVISHLIDQGYSGPEILTECITFAAAGMATTREFISVAAWHLLEHPELKAQYLNGTEAERQHLLHELLRLEPVVSHLYRRTTQDLRLETSEGVVTIPAGSLVDLDIRAANTDEKAVGDHPRHVCPARKTASGVQPYALSFGDGHHRCPGAYVAIQESDIFLQRLLSLDGLKILQAPTLTWNELVAGYELRKFIVAV